MWAAVAGGSVSATAGEARAQSVPAGAPSAAVGAAAPQEEIDDPKVARRLKTRNVPPAPAASAARSPAAAPVAPVASAARAVTSAPVAPAASVPVAASPGSGGALSPPASAAPRTESPPVVETTPAIASTPEVAGGQDTLTRKMTTEEEPRSSETNVPRLKIGFRRFSFVRVGATAGPQGTSAASEPFDVLSLDFYPASSYVRFGLSAQYGAESGKLAGGGDYFFAQTFSLGAQIPGRIFTPFAEGFGGAGYMRRLQFSSSVPTAYWQFGVDAGTEIFMAKYADVSVALGYVHAVNGFTRGLSFTSVYVDTWSFKLGFGF